MYNWAKALLVSLLIYSSLVQASPYPDAWQDIGRPATADELEAWDIDVRPDFTGLPEGAGSVAQGEGLWLDKCASCHGDFGDSNEVFSPIVLGNITPEDIASGRVAALTDSAVVRTTLMKVATLSTIWDYINRAMPWNAPKSLQTDEVYALTAYLLNLGYIVDDDFVLSNDNIHAVQAMMPNRYGMTTDHGLWSAAGRPDVVGSRCISDCNADTTITSFLPDYAMNAHGNLRDQMRDYGPYPGIQTAPEANVISAPVSTSTAPDALLLANGCSGCHQQAGPLLGPSFDDIMAKYKNQDATDYLRTKIKNGGSGVWGTMAMPPMPHVGEEALLAISQWLVAGR